MEFKQIISLVLTSVITLYLIILTMNQSKMIRSIEASNKRIDELETKVNCVEYLKNDEEKENNEGKEIEEGKEMEGEKHEGKDSVKLQTVREE